MFTLFGFVLLGAIGDWSIVAFLLLAGLFAILGVITDSATCSIGLTVVRTLGGPGIGGDNTVTVNGFNSQQILSGSTTPAVTKDAELSLPLVSGAVTLDLTAIADPDLGTINANGLGVQQFLFKNPSTNANAITIGKGATNGYTGFGATFSITIPPGGYYAGTLAGGASAIGSTSKTLDLSGTGTQALQIQLTFG